VKVPPSVFHLLNFFVSARALHFHTSSLKMMVAVAPVPSRTLIGTTVPTLFLISTIMLAVYCTGFFSRADSGSCFS
jgi:hypothetical protein